MPLTTKRFFEDAIELSGAINHSALARKIGVSSGTLSDWKKGRNFPSDKTMLKIALMCQLDPAEALALLNLWRCDETARGTYQKILEQVSRAKAPLAAVLFGTLMTSNLLNRLENLTEPPKEHHLTVYYEKLYSALFQWLGALFASLIYLCRQARLNILHQNHSQKPST